MFLIISVMCKGADAQNRAWRCIPCVAVHHRGSYIRSQRPMTLHIMRYHIILPAVLLLLGAGGCASNFLQSDPIRPKGVDLYVAGVKAYQAGDKKLAQARLEEATTVNPKLRMAHS